eukprot:4608806-Prymnesium_polylepis.1
MLDGYNDTKKISARGRPQRSPARTEGSLVNLPAHWSGRYAANDFACFPVNPKVLHALKGVFDVSDPEQLGIGRDVPIGPWKNASSAKKRLQLAAAWRIENPRLWKQYLSARDSVAEEVKQLYAKYKLHRKPLKTKLDAKLQEFRHAAKEAFDVPDAKETFLLHGTKPEVLLTVLSNGPSDKFSGGLFGEGIYLAETPTKNDQYTTIDEECISSSTGNAEVAALHERLYRSTTHPRS